MDIKQILKELSSLSMADLQQLSSSVNEEMNPSLHDLERWENKNVNRKFEWVVHQSKHSYSVACGGVIWSRYGKYEKQKDVMNAITTIKKRHWCYGEPIAFRVLIRG